MSYVAGRVFPLLLVFAVQAGYWGGLGPTETSRFELLLSALAQIVAIGLGFVWLAVGPYRRARPWKIDREDKAPFVILAVWLLIATIAAAHGVLGQRPLQYVLGDFYKFAILPVIFLLTYLLLENEPQLQLAVRWVPIVFGAVLVYDFLRFYPLLAQGQRFTSNAPVMIATLSPLICFMVQAPRSGVFFLLSAAVFVETMIALSFAQMLGGFVGFLLSLALLFVLRRRWLTLVLTLAVIVTFGLNMLGAIPVGFRRAETSSPATAFHGDSSALMALSPVHAAVSGPLQPVEPRAAFRVTRLDQYMAAKISEALRLHSVGPAADIIGGSRAAEIEGVLREIAWDPLMGVLGFGMGGELQPMALGLRQVSEHHDPFPWENAKHYIHAGLFEVLFRSGFAGLAVFLALLAVVFVRGMRLARSHEYGVFVMMNVIVQGCLLAFNEALMSPYLLLSLSFAGVAAIEREHRSRGRADGQKAVR